MSEVNMQAKIHAHIDRLFASVPADERVSEVKLELYMNTIDRYNDLVNEGKSPDEAYAEVIGGIGDVDEILDSLGYPTQQEASPKKERRAKGRRKLIYDHFCNVYWMFVLILYFTLSFATGAWHITWMTFLIATALLKAIRAFLDIRYAGKPDLPYQPTKEQKKLRATASSILWLLVLIVYFAVSFISHAWYITWNIFLLGSALESLLSIHCIMKDTCNEQKEVQQ
ncbi:MAG: hypothetical protein J6R04_06915 [Clostridia bacterium]|nr:hypothetical protein [Clostridia bacterium]